MSKQVGFDRFESNDDSNDSITFEGPTSCRPDEDWHLLPGSQLDYRELAGTGLAPFDFEILSGVCHPDHAAEQGYHPDDEHRADRRAAELENDGFRLTLENQPKSISEIMTETTDNNEHSAENTEPIEVAEPWELVDDHDDAERQDSILAIHPDEYLAEIHKQADDLHVGTEFTAEQQGSGKWDIEYVDPKCTRRDGSGTFHDTPQEAFDALVPHIKEVRAEKRDRAEQSAEMEAVEWPGEIGRYHLLPKSSERAAYYWTLVYTGKGALGREYREDELQIQFYNDTRRYYVEGPGNEYARKKPAIDEAVEILQERTSKFDEQEREAKENDDDHRCTDCLKIIPKRMFDRCSDCKTAESDEETTDIDDVPDGWRIESHQRNGSEWIEWVEDRETVVVRSEDRKFFGVDTAGNGWIATNIERSEAIEAAREYMGRVAAARPYLEDYETGHKTDEKPESGESSDGERDNERAVADGGEAVAEGEGSDPEPIAIDPDEFDPADHAGETVRLITGIVGLTSAPKILEAEISNSGKTMGVENRGKESRLDTETILTGESEYRDSTYFEIYTPGRLRARQRANHAPGPQAGANQVSDADDLPAPTHWPALEQPDELPDKCPGCGAVAAPFQTKNLISPRCEACGETIEKMTQEPEDEDDGEQWPDALDMQTWERGGVIETPDHSLLITRLRRAAGFDTVLRAEAVDRDGTEYTIRTPDNRLMMELGREQSPVVFVDEVPTFDETETNYAGTDEQRLRDWIRSKYDHHDDDRDNGGGISRDDHDGGSGGNETPTAMTDGGRDVDEFGRKIVSDLDALEEGAVFAYSHAEPGDDSRTFRVGLEFVDVEDFADYGEGSISFNYRDGYVADVPVSNVKRQISTGQIVLVESA